MDSDAESDDDGDYVPTEYEADSDLDTDYEDGFMDSDGFDVDGMDVDALLHRVGGGEAMIEGDERESITSSHAFPGYHESHDLEAQSVSCGSEAGWWDRSVDDEQNEWGLTDGDSMSTSEGELSVGELLGMYHVTRHRTLCLRLCINSCWAETNVQVRLDSEGEYAIYEDGDEPKC